MAYVPLLPTTLRPITLGAVTLNPVGTTPSGWECFIISYPSGEYSALVDDGFGRHVTDHAQTWEGAAWNLGNLIVDLHHVIVCAKGLATAGAN